MSRRKAEEAKLKKAEMDRLKAEREEAKRKEIEDAAEKRRLQNIEREE